MKIRIQDVDKYLNAAVFQSNRRQKPRNSEFGEPVSKKLRGGRR